MAPGNEQIHEETEKAMKKQMRPGELKPVTTDQKQQVTPRGGWGLFSAGTEEQRQNPLKTLLNHFYTMAGTLGRFFHSQVRIVAL